MQRTAILHSSAHSKQLMLQLFGWGVLAEPGQGVLHHPHRKADAATQCDFVADLALGQMDLEEQVELHELIHEAAEGPQDRLVPEPTQMQVALTCLLYTSPSPRDS